VIGMPSRRHKHVRDANVQVRGDPTLSAVGVLEQDYLRRIVLREHDNSKIEPVAPGFITATAATLLASGYHVVLEGILHRERYGEALHKLITGHPGPSAVYYLDIPLPEALRRHQERAHTVGFTTTDMTGWYTPDDYLHVDGEHVIDHTSSLDDTVTTILHTSGLAHAARGTPCPTRCPRCAEKETDRR